MQTKQNRKTEEIQKSGCDPDSKEEESTKSKFSAGGITVWVKKSKHSAKRAQPAKAFKHALPNGPSGPVQEEERPIAVHKERRCRALNCPRP
ncbi:MAG: hypothetical protein JWM16_5431 [Verrucomicrobiales bacterium]|nr:hypothetical protein [Verrucomicrobiales bacterium]